MMTMTCENPNSSIEEKAMISKTQIGTDIRTTDGETKPKALVAAAEFLTNEPTSRMI